MHKVKGDLTIRILSMLLRISEGHCWTDKQIPQGAIPTRRFGKRKGDAIGQRKIIKILSMQRAHLLGANKMDSYLIARPFFKSNHFFNKSDNFFSMKIKFALLIKKGDLH